MLFWLTLIQSLPTIPDVTPEAIVLEAYDEDGEAIAWLPESTSNGITNTLPPSQPVVGQLGGLIVFPGVIGGVILLLLLSIWAYTRVYVITPNNEAFVRTGGVFVKKKSVILNGGCVVLPGFHELTRVPLREISIDVERTGKLAVRTQDYLRADMRVTFYVCINASEEDVLTAAARLSQGGKISSEDIKNALEKRADDAIRAAAKTKRIAEIDSDKLGFAQEVLNLMQPDLAKVGLTLNNIAISEIQESDTYDENNFFDAQGVRLRTETIQRSIQQKREVELNTQVMIEQKELDAEKRSLNIQQETESARLEQQLQVEALKAQREREIQEAKDREAAATQRTKILQQKSVEEEEIRRQLGIQQSQIEADIELEERNKALKVARALQQQESEVAEINRQKAVEEEEINRRLAIQQRQIEADIELEERNKALKVAKTLQQREAEVAEIERQQTVDSSTYEAQVQIAEAERQARIAQEDVAIAIANKRKTSLEAEAQRAQAEEAVKTASDMEVAERQRQLAVIAAQQTAEERRIADQNVVEIDVFRRKRQAEIAKQAADLEAESILTLAEANRQRALAEAEGLRAQMLARNLISNANLTADLIQTIWPELSEKLPDVVKALAPQPGVLGETRIFAFPGANGNNGTGSGALDINKLLLSTSGLSLINTLLDEGKLATLLGQVKQLLQENPNSTAIAQPGDNPPETNASDSFDAS
jgi:uncharacterized membrane protein YqiK